MDLKVLYEDNHLIAVFKPAGILVQGDSTGDKCLMDYVKEYLKKTYKKEGNVFLGLLHRLDRPVSGIVLFAKTSKGAARLSEQIRNRTIKKKYTVLVGGRPKLDSSKLVHYLVKNETKNKVWAYDSEVKDSLEAILSYDLISFDGEKSLLKIDLYTGRHHQIRAQMAAIGCSIVGDTKYGSKFAYMNGKAICLCASELIFKAATTDEIISLKIEADFKYGN
jgi:23S rRNA pseudouridine1911/1915/1917 synthase